jgi:hypothetical protein
LRRAARTCSCRVAVSTSLRERMRKLFISRELRKGDMGLTEADVLVDICGDIPMVAVVTADSGESSMTVTEGVAALK